MISLNEQLPHADKKKDTIRLQVHTRYSLFPIYAWGLFLASVIYKYKTPSGFMSHANRMQLKSNNDFALKCDSGLFMADIDLNIII